MIRSVAATARLMVDAASELRQPRVWLPAACLLLPSLLLQLAFPNWLRTRLSPSTSTVIIGSVFMAWTTQVAAAASCGWVDALRRRRQVRWSALARTALQVGTATLLGLVAGVWPGLWLQARLAHLPLQREVTRPPQPRTPGLGLLLGVAAVALVTSLLGQTLPAGLAEALNTIVPAAVVDGRIQFRLNYLPHLLTSLLAYAFTVFALTWQAASVSVGFEQTSSVAEASNPHAARSRSGLTHRVVGRPLLALSVAFGVLVMLGAGLASAMYKVQQHLY
jgi:hypothetical protein